MTLIAVGVTFFMLKRLDFYPTSELVSDIRSAIDTSVLIGLSLTVLSLAFDGYTGSTQDTFIARHKPSTQQLMLYVRNYSRYLEQRQNLDVQITRLALFSNLDKYYIYF